MLNPEIYVEGEDGSQNRCHLVGIAGGHIQLISQQYITEFSHVLIHFSHITVAGQVAYAHRKDDRYRVSIALEGYRRSEPRFPLSDRCQATILSDDYRIISGQLKNVSSSGLGLLLEASCPIGAMVYVETARMLIVGEIRHCRQISQSEYLVGLAITEAHEDISPTRHKRWRSRLQEWVRS